jgi:hypothetical protein
MQETGKVAREKQEKERGGKRGGHLRVGGKEEIRYKTKKFE